MPGHDHQSDACVFLGPTLKIDEAKQYINIDFRPPAAMGDVYRAIQDGFRVIGLVDGYFEQRAAVWHKEILWGLSKGVRIIGSSSIGALRAAELAPFGMEGIGRVFEAFRDSALIDDDEVAVRHGPAELGYILLSTAMVDIRFTITKARQLGILSDTEAGTLVNLAKTLHFPKRSYRSVCDIARVRGVSTSTIAIFLEWLQTERVEQKKYDAIALLHIIDASQDTKQSQAEFEFQYTSAWQQLRDFVHRNDHSHIEAAPLVLA